MRSISGTRRLLKWIGNGLLVVMLVWTLVPFYWMIVTSLKKDREIYGYEATLVPRQPTFEAYRVLFTKTPFVKYVRNSTIIAVATTLTRSSSGVSGPTPSRDSGSRAGHSSRGGSSSRTWCRRRCCSSRCSRCCRRSGSSTPTRG